MNEITMPLCGVCKEIQATSFNHAPPDCKPGDMDAIDCDHNPMCDDCIINKVRLMNLVDNSRN